MHNIFDVTEIYLGETIEKLVTLKKSCSCNCLDSSLYIALSILL